MVSQAELSIPIGPLFNSPTYFSNIDNTSSDIQFCIACLQKSIGVQVNTNENYPSSLIAWRVLKSDLEEISNN
jgi:hypothetical protein